MHDSRTFLPPAYLIPNTQHASKTPTVTLVPRPSRVWSAFEYLSVMNIKSGHNHRHAGAYCCILTRCSLLAALRASIRASIRACIRAVFHQNPNCKAQEMCVCVLHLICTYGREHFFLFFGFCYCEEKPWETRILTNFDQFHPAKLESTYARKRKHNSVSAVGKSSGEEGITSRKRGDCFCASTGNIARFISHLDCRGASDVDKRGSMATDSEGELVWRGGGTERIRSKEKNEAWRHVGESSRRHGG